MKEIFKDENFTDSKVTVKLAYLENITTAYIIVYILVTIMVIVTDMMCVVYVTLYHVI